MIITIHFHDTPTTEEMHELLQITKDVTFSQNKARVNATSRVIALSCWDFYLKHKCENFTWVNII